MPVLPSFSLALTRLLLVLTDRLPDERDRERGDVPGWVLITVMTGALVTVIWAVAQTKLQTLLQNALDSVKGP